MARYLNVGSITRRKGKEGGEVLQFELDNVSLSEFIDLIKEHGKRYLGDMNKEDIKAGQELKWDDPKRIPRLTFGVFEPKTTNENVRKFVMFNISKKVD